MSSAVWPERAEVSFDSAGDTCAAWFSAPTDDAVSHPCVVMGHGFSLTRYDGLDGYAGAFARAGSAVLAFDYRYFGDSGGQPRQRFRRRQQVADFRRAVEFARVQPGVDPTRIVVWGFSFGAAHAIELAISDASLAAAIVVCPFVDGLRRVLATPPSLSAWILPRALRDQAGRHNVIPVTGPPGAHAAMTLAGEAEGFASAVRPGSPWRNEISPAVFLSVGAYRPVTRAAKIGVPLWVGLGESDGTTAAVAVERLAVSAAEGELHRYPVGHFGPFGEPMATRMSADQVNFLHRFGVLSPESRG